MASARPHATRSSTTNAVRNSDRRVRTPALVDTDAISPACWLAILGADGSPGSATTGHGRRIVSRMLHEFNIISMLAQLAMLLKVAASLTYDIHAPKCRRHATFE